MEARAERLTRQGPCGIRRAGEHVGSCPLPNVEDLRIDERDRQCVLDHVSDDVGEVVRHLLDLDERAADRLADLTVSRKSVANPPVVQHVLRTCLQEGVVGKGDVRPVRKHFQKLGTLLWVVQFVKRLFRKPNLRQRHVIGRLNWDRAVVRRRSVGHLEPGSLFDGARRAIETGGPNLSAGDLVCKVRPSCPDRRLEHFPLPDQVLELLYRVRHRRELEFQSANDVFLGPALRDALHPNGDLFPDDRRRYVWLLRKRRPTRFATDAVRVHRAAEFALVLGLANLALNHLHDRLLNPAVTIPVSDRANVRTERPVAPEVVQLLDEL